MSYEAEQQLQQIAATVQQHQAQAIQDTSQIISEGRANFGAREFDEASQVVAAAVGDNRAAMMIRFASLISPMPSSCTWRTTRIGFSNSQS